MPWVKGQSGNIKGRPPGNRSIWRDTLLREIEKDPDALRKAARKCLQLAIQGDIPALKEIADRLDGKAHQSVAIEGGFEAQQISLEEQIRMAREFANLIGHDFVPRAPTNGSGQHESGNGK